jgi:WD40 repeat protein
VPDSVPIEDAQPASPSAGGERLRFDVFLSHSSRDKPVVERIAEKLKQAGLEPWLDKWSLIAGVNWQRGLAEGIAASRSCAVFVGPDDLGAWANQEVAVALDRAAKDPGFRVFLVLLPGLPEQFDATNLLPFLRMRTWVDFRSGLDGGRAFENLVCAVRGVPFGPALSMEPREEVCPYRGLEAFEEEHAEFFFGREADVQRLLEKLKGTRFLAVLGASGSGKSSLVRAGLIPAVRNGSDYLEIALFRPGAHPLGALAARVLRLGADGAMQQTLDRLASDERTLHLAVSLALAETRVLFVIDQFEEVFTLCRDEAERRAFFANLTYAASVPDGPSGVLLTMRADFYHRCGGYPELAQQLAAQQYLVSPMQTEGLRQAIREPARSVGLSLEPGLVDTILADVSGQPGALPLLEHALLELWERRRAGVLTLEGYRDSGGVQGAIAQRADDVFESLAPDKQELARRTFLRLTQPGEGTEDTRRRAPLAELSDSDSDNDFVRLVGKLVDARLLTTSRDETLGGEVVEVAHEALIRGWPRLRRWIDEDRAGLLVHRRLTEATQEWQRLERDSSSLYRGARLAEAFDWRATNDESLNDAERLFLDTSRKAEQDELERERQRSRRLRSLAVGLGALLTAAVFLAVVAIRQSDQARRRQHESLSRDLAAKSRDNLDARYELALLLGLEAHRLANTFEARSAALGAEQRATSIIASLRHGGSVRDVAAARDGETFATVGERAIRLWDVDTRRQLRAWSSKRGTSFSSVMFRGDGSLLAAEVGDRRARIRNLTNGRLVGKPLEGVPEAANLSLTPDGRKVVVANDEGRIQVWDVATGQTLGPTHHVAGWPDSRIAFTSDGAAFAVEGPGGIRLASVATGSLLRRRFNQSASSGGVAFSNDGKTMAAIGRGFPAVIRLWDLATGRLAPGPFKKADEFDSDLAISADGQIIAALDSGTIGLWDVASHLQIGQRLRGATGSIRSFAFIADGKTLVSGSDDGTIRLWRVPAVRTLKPPPGKRPATVTFSPDAAVVAMRTALSFESDKKTIWLQDASTGGLLGRPFEATLPAQSNVAVSSGTRSRIALGRGNGEVWLWDRTGNARGKLLPPQPSYTQGVAFSPSGRLLASGSRTGTIRLWDLPKRRSFKRLLFTPDQEESTFSFGLLSTVVFGPGGGVLAAGSEEGAIVIWNVAGRRLLGAPIETPNTYVVALAFSRNGRVIAAGYDDNTIRLWDVAQRRQLGGAIQTGQTDLDALTFSPAGDSLLSIGLESPQALLIRTWDSRLWSGDRAAITARGCEIVTRNLTRREWSEFIPDEPYRRTCQRWQAGR